MTRRAAWFPAAVLLITVVELVAATVVPGVDQFEGKGWPVRLVIYPLLMVVAPTVWWLTRDRRANEPPVGALLAVLEEISEWWPFIRNGTEAAGRPHVRRWEVHVA